MSISNVIALLSGVALFLFGMSLMGDGLKKVAGNQLELTLYRLTSNPLKGILLGTGVTAVIQSSSATSVMVVGFVNSGMMKLKQATGIILGAILGTSITGWILCLSEVGGETTSSWMSLFSTATITGLVAVIGIILRMTSKEAKKKHLADIMLGFAVLMTGMSTMSSAVSVLKQSESFLSLMTNFSNPVLGILIGVLVTSVLQSASAAVGILQAMSVTGAITFAAAFPLIMGIAIGAAVPVILSSLDANTEAKRSAFSYLFINGAGTVVCALLFYGFHAVSPVSFYSQTLNTVGVSLVNTLFRLIVVLILAPFLSWICQVMAVLVPQNKNEQNEMEDIDRLEDIFIAHPALAVEQSKQAIASMAEKTRENLTTAISLLREFNEEHFKQVELREDVIDKYEDKLGSYLVKLTGKELDHQQNEEVSKFLHTISDFERIADHACNIAEAGQEMHEKKIAFSEDAQYELDIVQAAVKEIVNLSFHAFVKEDLEQAIRVEPLEEVIDGLCRELKLHHVSRVQQGYCTLELGFVFNDLLTNYERIADHCSNLAVAMIELQSDSFDTHEYLRSMKKIKDDSFTQWYEEYSDEFSLE